MVQKCGLVLCLLANITWNDCQDSFFQKLWFPSEQSELRYLKNGNMYEIVRDKPKEHPGQGYVEITDTIMQQFEPGNTSIDKLNNFEMGIKQFFLFQLYKKITTKALSVSPNINNISDPILLSDQHVENIDFKDLKVYGFSAFQNIEEVLYDAMRSATEFDFQATFKSNAIIFTGFFVISGSTYFFTYNMEGNTYKWCHRAVRGLQDPQYSKISLEYQNSRFIHSYDSSKDDYAQINDTVTKTFIDLLIAKWQSELKNLLAERVEKLILQNDQKFVYRYHEKLLSAIVHSAINYLRVKRLNTFNIKPINFTSVTGARKYVQIYKNIKVENAINFEKFINSTDDLSIENSREVKLSSRIQFIYPEGEKQSFISFEFGDGMRKNVRKFNIKTMSIIAAYKCMLNKRPFAVTRDKDVFMNNYGFLIDFELDEDFDPIYGFLIKHIANDMARVIEEILMAGTD